MPDMRAKLKVTKVDEIKEHDGPKAAESVSFMAVGKKDYEASGLDEDNTFAYYTPSATFDIHIANPALFGKFKQGDTFYVDFTKVE